MNRLLVLAAAFVVAAVMAVAAGATVARDAFSGVWVGVEAPVGDGSTDVMVISPPGLNGNRKFLYWENNASGYCGGGPLSASGTAHSVGDVLTVTFTSTHCANGSPGSFPPPFDINMIATKDGHIDFNGVIFSRAGAS